MRTPNTASHSTCSGPPIPTVSPCDALSVRQCDQHGVTGHNTPFPLPRCYPSLEALGTMAKVLTVPAVERLKPDPKKRLEVPDGLLPGLYFVIQPSGARSW